MVWSHALGLCPVHRVRAEPQHLNAVYVAVLRQSGDRSVLVITATMTLTLALLAAGLFWLNIAQKPFLKDAQNTIGLLFFELLFLAFRTMFTALFTFPNEYKMVRVHS